MPTKKTSIRGRDITTSQFHPGPRNHLGSLEVEPEAAAKDEFLEVQQAVQAVLDGRAFGIHTYSPAMEGGYREGQKRVCVQHVVAHMGWESDRLVVQTYGRVWRPPRDEQECDHAGHREHSCSGQLELARGRVEL